MKNRSTKKILIVDDDIDVQIYLSTLLAGKGFNVLVARSETEGFEKAQSETPDLIIMNMVIAGEMGIRFYNSIKSDTKLGRIPIIMISAIQQKTFFHYQRLQHYPKGTEIAMPEAFLSRPPEAAELIGVVDKILSEKSRKRKKTAKKSRNTATHKHKKKVKEGPWA